MASLWWGGFTFAAPARRQNGPLDMTWWDPYVPDITDVDTYLRRKFRQDVTDKTTGLDSDALKKLLAEIVASGKASGESWRVTKAKCFATQVVRQSIDVSPFDWFPAIAVWDRWSRPISTVIWEHADEVNARTLPEWVRKEWEAGNADGIWTMWQDFDHSVPDWRVIMMLGFTGMNARLEKYAVKGDPFYEGLRITMDAMFAGIDGSDGEEEEVASRHEGVGGRDASIGGVGRGSGWFFVHHDAAVGQGASCAELADEGYVSFFEGYACFLGDAPCNIDFGLVFLSVTEAEGTDFVKVFLCPKEAGGAVLST